MRNGRAPAGFQPKGRPMWLQTRCPNSTFETAKSMEVPVVGTHATRQSPMDSSRQTGAQTAPSKPLKAWRYRWWAHATRQSPSRVPAQGVANVAADEVPKHAFETAKSMEVPEVGTHAKRQSPSRIPAQPAKDRRADRGLTYPLNPSNSCRKPSKTHLLGSHKIGTKSSRTDGWKHFQTVGLEKRKRRKQDSSPRGGQSWLQTRCPNTPSKPLKAWRYRWWARMRNGRAPAGFQPNPPKTDGPTEA